MLMVIEHLASGESVDRGAVCPGENDLASPAITSEVVLRALERIKLPRPELSIQPPGGKTLVNLETIFSTSAEPFTEHLRLLGQRVIVELAPATYLWQHGDDTTQTTDSGGLPYERGLPLSGYITHVYSAADVTVHPQVTTTWSARFRTGSQPWQVVNGTVSATSAPLEMRVVEATPLLVAAPR